MLDEGRGDHHEDRRSIPSAVGAAVSASSIFKQPRCFFLSARGASLAGLHAAAFGADYRPASGLGPFSGQNLLSVFDTSVVAMDLDNKPTHNVVAMEKMLDPWRTHGGRLLGRDDPGHGGRP